MQKVVKDTTAAFPTRIIIYVHKDPFLVHNSVRPSHISFLTGKYTLGKYSVLIFSCWCVCMNNEPLKNQEWFCLITSWNCLDMAEIFYKNKMPSKKFTSNLGVSIRGQKNKTDEWKMERSSHKSCSRHTSSNLFYKYYSVSNAFA